MRNDCEKCKLDQDGRCQECMNLLGDYLSEISAIQHELSDKIRVATQELETKGRSITASFKTRPHQCDGCLRANADLTLATLMRNISPQSPLSPGAATDIYKSFKSGLTSMGIAKTPLLDKALDDSQKS